MNTPLVLVALAYSLGIIIGRYFILPLWISLTLLSLLAISGYYSLGKKNWTSLIILALFLLLGLFIYQFKKEINSDDLAKYADNGYWSVIGTINDFPRVKDDRLFFPLRVESIGSGKQPSKLEALIFASIPSQDIHLGYGQRLEVRGVIKSLQSFKNPLMGQGETRYSLFAISYSVLPGHKVFWLKVLALYLSQRFNEVLTKILPAKEASLFGSFLLGSTVSPLPDDQKERYRQAGLIHLLVVSGTQVSIMIGVSLTITRGLAFPLWLSVAVTSFFNLMLVIMTGAGASIIRAAIMGEIAIIGVLFDKQKDIYTSLALSALLILVFDPPALFNLGFQLSFAATWSLFYIVPIIKEWLKRLTGAKKLSFTLSLLSTTIAPILATSPILAYNFSQIAWGGLISNLLVLPWVEFLVILGLVSTIVGFICLPLAQILGQTIWLLLNILQGIANCVAALPGACFYIHPPTPPIIIGYYIFLVAFLEALKTEYVVRVTRKRLLVVLGLLITIFLWHKIFLAESIGRDELKVTFLDVGQGDCSLLEMPSGQKVLIDGGGIESLNNSGVGDQIGERVVVPFLHRQGINKLDLVVLTHPHNDHLGGLNSVLDKIKIDKIIDNGAIYSSAAYRRFKELIAFNRIKHLNAHQGQVINFGQNIRGEILNPAKRLLGDTNSDSVVIRLVYNQISFLLTGDLGQLGEEQLLASWGHSIRSTVLKVGHHGSATSTTDGFLKKVSPKYAVISVGHHNRYHHPTKIVLNKLRANRIEVYRTDKNGAITIKTDGQKLAIDCQIGPRSPKKGQPSS